MMTGSERAVGEYLDRLERSLRRLPPRQRRAILEEVGEHLDDALAEPGPDPAEAAVRTALDRLGDPDDIAREARARFGMGSGVPSWTDALAIVLLLLGGFLWVSGWIAGVVLLWMSDVWSTRDKLVGTLVVPGGLLPAVWWAFRTTSCETSPRGEAVPARDRSYSRLRSGGAGLYAGSCAGPEAGGDHLSGRPSGAPGPKPSCGLPGSSDGPSSNAPCLA
jgi:hypothetical protein